MDVALADFIHSNLLLFNFAEGMKLIKVIYIESILPARYNPPNRNGVSGILLDTLYDVNWNSGIRSLFNDCRRFGISFFGY